MPASPHIRPSKDRDARAFTNSTAASASLQPSASRSIGESLWSVSRAFGFSRLHSTANPGAMLPGLFFDALSSIRCLPEFPNPFPRRPACRESHGANAETCPTHARFLSFRAAQRERWRLISRARSEKGLCICKIREIFHPEAQESPRAFTKKRSKEKT
jgi:hypothetical protein